MMMLLYKNDIHLSQQTGNVIGLGMGNSARVERHTWEDMEGSLFLQGPRHLAG